MVKSRPANAVDMGLIPGLVRFHKAQRTIEPVLWSLGAASTEAHPPQSPRSTAGEATAMGSWSTTTREGLPLATTREKPALGNEDLAQPQIIN